MLLWRSFLLGIPRPRRQPGPPEGEGLQAALKLGEKKPRGDAELRSGSGDGAPGIPRNPPLAQPGS